MAANFGYHATIPFCGSNVAPWQADHALGAQPASLAGRTFVRRYQFQWERTRFSYATGEGEQRHAGQIATRIQSPPTGFEQLLLQPLSERRA